MESIYGEYLNDLLSIQKDITGRIEAMREELKERLGSDPVEHCLSRIKADDSMREKLRKKGLPETAESALFEVRDALGFRIVCGFVKDVYRVRDYLEAFPDVEIIREKDYIRKAKENGYRSLHLILQLQGKFYAEVQLRTISMDTWAALEHHMKYKKELGANTDLIVKELKRCADELASTDLSMQTLKDMIDEL